MKLQLRRSAAIRDWMFGAALPLWARNGVDDAHGGFVEALDFAGADAALSFKRTRVTARQVYVFSHAAVMGRPDWLDLAQRGMDYLASRAFMPERNAFARRLTRAGEVLDPTIDLYDHAFIVFASAWHYRATGLQSSLDWAHRTLDAIEAHLVHPSGLGFLHAAPATGWRQQNPHMHLLEAALAGVEAGGGERFRRLALRLTDLFANHFYQPASGRLLEFFDEALSPAPGEPGQLVEPGHQFEWAWLLAQCDRVLGTDFAGPIHALATGAEQTGVDGATGAAFNAMRLDGTVIDRGSRTWPNTERLKAAIALHERLGVDSSAMLASATDLLLDRYLAGVPAGGWRDAFDGEGRPTAADMPTSTLYHVFLAFSEVLRLDGAPLAGTTATHA